MEEGPASYRPGKLNSEPRGDGRAMERVCRCLKGGMDRPEGVAVCLTVRGLTLWVPLDTGAKSIWVDRDWIRSVGGTWTADEWSALATDENKMAVCGRGVFRFSMWGRAFYEPVRVAANLPSTVLMGYQFWRKHGLELNLSTDKAKIWMEGRRIRGRVRREDGDDSQLEFAAAVSDAEIDDAIIDMDLSAFHPTRQM